MVLCLAPETEWHVVIASYFARELNCPELGRKFKDYYLGFVLFMYFSSQCSSSVPEQHQNICAVSAILITAQFYICDMSPPDLA